MPKRKRGNYHSGGSGVSLCLDSLSQFQALVCTCVTNKESKAVAELTELLEDLISVESDDEEQGESDSVLKSLQDEVNELNSKSNQQSKNKISNVRLEMRGTVFIRLPASNSIDSVDLASRIITGNHAELVGQRPRNDSDSDANNEIEIRHLRTIVNIFPIQFFCKPYIDNVMEVLSLQVTALPSACQFRVDFYHRNNTSIDRSELFSRIHNLFTSMDPFSSANYLNPDVIILVQTIQSVCGVAIILKAKEQFPSSGFNYRRHVLK